MTLEQSADDGLGAGRVIVAQPFVAQLGQVEVMRETLRRGTQIANRRRPTLRPGQELSEIAVSTFSVLAGRYRPCGSLAASTWPVPASAMTHAEALIFGSRGTEPDG